ncbi:MAG: plastocyanin/azurin family copper-binding protein [Crocinitomicaceae bacterium]|nr:plastocyanin/azurin family copper-binding protein [Crocinitomicaceae bacterium]
MKNFYTTILSLFISGLCFSQTAGLFFSEYAEGSSNNKYLEIYNGTGTTVDLGLFSISSCSNGCDTFNEFDYPDNIQFASGTMLADGAVYIIAHPSADSSILAVANQTFQYLSNGDDAFALTLLGATPSNYTIIDLIGDMQGDPGSGWEVAGIANGTKDYTLIRKASVCQGNPVELGSFGTDSLNSEWVVMPQNDWTDIGSHTASCSSGSSCSANAGMDQKVCKGDTVILNAIGPSPVINVNHTVQTSGMAFSPDSITINLGDTVTFINTSGNHNVNGTTATFPSNPASFGNSLGTGWTFTHVFTVAGTYDYQCDPHAGMGMTGKVIVSPATSNLSYTWLNLSNPMAMPIVAQQTSFIATSTEDYMLIVIDSITNCLEMDTVTINVSDIAISAGANQTICEGDTAILTATTTGGFPSTFIYWISLNAGAATQSVTPNTTTTYDVVAIDTIGCKAFDSVKVIVNNVSNNTISESGIDSVVVNGQTYTSTGTYTQALTNAAGCDSILTINVTINTSTGLTDFEALQINAYPNPSSGIVKIQGIEKLGVIYGINIQNSEGRILKKISKDYSEINISDLRSGIYFLNIQHENGEGIIRIIRK